MGVTASHRRMELSRTVSARKLWGGAPINATITEDQEPLITDNAQNHSKLVSSNTPVYNEMMEQRTPT